MPSHHKQHAFGRQDGYLPIENYALIGNMRTAALCGSDGAIDFWCYPKFDSPSVFARVVDRNIGGHFTIQPADIETRTKQQYLPNSNILQTKFLANEGAVHVTDLMPVRRSRDSPFYPWLQRTASCMRGKLRMRIELFPAFNYARTAHSVVIRQNKSTLDPITVVKDDNIDETRISIHDDQCNHSGGSTSRGQGVPYNKTSRDSKWHLGTKTIIFHTDEAFSDTCGAPLSMDLRYIVSDIDEDVRLEVEDIDVGPFGVNYPGKNMTYVPNTWGPTYNPTTTTTTASSSNESNDEKLNVHVVPGTKQTSTPTTSTDSESVDPGVAPTYEQITKGGKNAIGSPMFNPIPQVKIDDRAASFKDKTNSEDIGNELNANVHKKNKSGATSPGVSVHTAESIQNNYSPRPGESGTMTNVTMSPFSDLGGVANEHVINKDESEIMTDDFNHENELIGAFPNTPKKDSSTTTGTVGTTSNESKTIFDSANNVFIDFNKRAKNALKLVDDTDVACQHPESENHEHHHRHHHFDHHNNNFHSGGGLKNRFLNVFNNNQGLDESGFESSTSAIDENSDFELENPTIVSTSRRRFSGVGENHPSHQDHHPHLPHNNNKKTPQKISPSSPLKEKLNQGISYKICTICGTNKCKKEEHQQQIVEIPTTTKFTSASDEQQTFPSDETFSLSAQNLDDTNKHEYVRLKWHIEQKEGMQGPGVWAEFDLIEGQRITFIFRERPLTSLKNDETNDELEEICKNANKEHVEYDESNQFESMKNPHTSHKFNRPSTSSQQQQRASTEPNFIQTKLSLPDPPLTESLVDELLMDTLHFWTKWIERSTYQGRWRETVNRSALTLKLLTYKPTGAVVAAPTFGLPEEIGGTRNWDYRFTWIRDSSFTIYALIRIGMTDEARDFMKFIRKCWNTMDNNGALRVMYSINGVQDLPEQVLDHFEGYRKSPMVRIGNAATEHLQLDIYGELMDSMYLFSKYGTPVSYDQWLVIRKMVNYVCANWMLPDMSIWEVRGVKEQFVYSKIMCWVAVDRGLRFIDKKGLPCPEREVWLKTRDEIYFTVMERGYSKKHGCFTQTLDSEDTPVLDASVLIAPLVFFISPGDPRMISTLKKIMKPPSKGGLLANNLMYRYDRSAYDDGVDGTNEGSFSMCTFWLTEALCRAGKYYPSLLRRSVMMFEQMVTYGNHVQLFSEEVSATGEMLGNFPQAFTHIALVSAAYNLDRDMRRPTKD